MATQHKYKHKEKKRWTYGSELELADWPCSKNLPKGIVIDNGAYTNVNSNGVAVDGPGRLYGFGGEILTNPSIHVMGPAEQFDEIKDRWPETSLNYRMGLNIHIRVPGLQDDLKGLKRVQRFIHRVMPKLLPVIDPIPEPVSGESARAKKCFNTRRNDHHTLVKSWRLTLQYKTTTPKEFFEAEAIHLPTGRVHWAINLRACVNLRQMLQTDTIEFRHFFMPVSADELFNATLWCKRFLAFALEGSDISAEELLDEFDFSNRVWPTPMKYNSWLDNGWHHTSRKKHPLEEIPRRIEDWLENNPKPRGETKWLK